MKKPSTTSAAGGLLLGALLSLATQTAAQPVTERANCHFVGPTAMEPLGEANHLLQVGNYTCEIVAGPFKGGVMTGTTIWEHRGASAAARGGIGVMRRQDATSVYTLGDGQLKTTMQDGRPSGWSASGKGAFTTGAGAAASLQKKSIDWRAQATGPNTFVLEWQTE